MLDILKREMKFLNLACNLIIKAKVGGKVNIEKIQHYIIESFNNDKAFTEIIIDCL